MPLPHGRFLKLRDKESITDYIKRHVDEDRIFVGVEGDELTLTAGGFPLDKLK